MIKSNDKFLTHAPRALVLIVAALAIPFALAACNTVEGAGEDVEAVGEAIDETAEDASN